MTINIWAEIGSVHFGVVLGTEESHVAVALQVITSLEVETQ